MTRSIVQPVIPFTRDILPLFIVGAAPPHPAVSFEGTAFLIGRGIVVTCYHCVAKPLAATQAYAVLMKEAPGTYTPALIADLERDHNGADLALGHVGINPNLPTVLSPGGVAPGTDVFAIGYPLTRYERTLRGEERYTLGTRFLKGYITSDADYEHPSEGRIPSYELDMPAPAGLSGAPLYQAGSGGSVIGVVYGTNDVATIEEYAAINPETGARQPEVHRIISFGLAHHTDTVRNVRGHVTGGLPLHEFLSSSRAPAG